MKIEVKNWLDKCGDDMDAVKEMRRETDKILRKFKGDRQKFDLPISASIEAVGIAENLWRLVHERYPFVSPPDLLIWSVEVDRIHRIDGHDWILIEVVMAWSQEDTFWRQQIRSATNLRKHFEKLMIRIKETEDGRSRVYSV